MCPPGTGGAAPSDTERQEDNNAMQQIISEREVIRLVRALRPLILDRTGAADVHEKSAANYVTATDLAVQHTLSRQLGERWPGIQFMGEEEGAVARRPDRPMWILDPIDGTANLVHGYGESAVSLALWDGREVVLGVVYNPFREEVFSATRGMGSRCNGGRIRCSGRADLGHSLAIFGSSPYEKVERADALFDSLKRLYLHTEDLRRGGSAAIDLCRVAAGRAELYFEYNLKPWDYAAGQLIIREAGGVCTTMDGGRLCPLENADILVTNGLIHAQALSLLRGTEKGG